MWWKHGICFLSVTWQNSSLYISSYLAYQVKGGFYFFQKYYKCRFCPSKRKISWQHVAKCAYMVAAIRVSYVYIHPFLSTSTLLICLVLSSSLWYLHPFVSSYLLSHLYQWFYHVSSFHLTSFNHTFLPPQICFPLHIYDLVVLCLVIYPLVLTPLCIFISTFSSLSKFLSCPFFSSDIFHYTFLPSLIVFLSISCFLWCLVI